VQSVAGSSDPFRLSDVVTPQAYDIYLKASPARATFSGRETISVIAKSPVDTFSLNAATLGVESVDVRVGAERLKATLHVDEEHERVDLRFALPIPAGRIEIDVRFKGHVRNDLQGLYLGQDGGEAALVSQCEAAAARSIFPCFDEPAFKASVRWTVETDPGYQVVANGMPLATAPTPDGLAEVHSFAPTKPIASYLTAVTVGHYDATDPVIVSKVPSRLWVARGHVAQAAYAQEVTAFGVPWLERYFGQDYPFEKLDQVGVPGFDAGAMENAGDGRAGGGRTGRRRVRRAPPGAGGHHP